MLTLPKIPFKMAKNKRVSVPIGNFNLSSRYKDGDIAFSKGISARKYPYLTTKKTNVKQSGYSDVLAMTVFNGRLVTARKESEELSAIYIENDKVCDLSGTNERQFTAINTKLVIMPDGVYLENGDDGVTVHRLAEEVDCGTANFSASSIQAMGASNKVASGYGYTFKDGVFTVKASDKKTVRGTFGITSNHYNKDDGYSVLVPLRRKLGGYLSTIRVDSDHTIEIRTGYMTDAEWDNAWRSDIEKACIQYNQKCYIVENLLYRGYEVETSTGRRRIVWKSKSLDSLPETLKVFAGPPWGELGEKRLAAVYLIYQGRSLSLANDPSIDFSFFSKTKNRYIDIAYQGNNIISGRSSGVFNIDTDCPELRIYDDLQYEGIIGDVEINVRGWSLSELGMLKAGDSIQILGFDTLFHIDSKTSTSLTLSSESDVEDKSSDERSITNIFKISNDDRIFGGLKVGDAVEVSGCSEEDNNITFIIADIQGDIVYAESDIFTPGISTTTVTVARRFPDLDFICEKDNRLYGVVNKEKTIFVSALGDPTNMYVYQGLSTDSYAVAVGGEGDFTGCCKYGESVIFFKEDKMYKLMGAYPAEFSLYSTDVDGLQKGAHKSMAIINEVLYYKGKNGIFAYGGGTPTLISSNFGEHIFSDAVGGSDGISYYVSMTEDGNNYLMAYNTRLGLWTLEDDERCVDFARTSDGLYCATKDGEVYLMNASSDSSATEWLVQFVPFFETMEGKKTYSRLLMRVEIPVGSYMIVEVRNDGGAWREAGKIVGSQYNIIPVHLPISRCDKFEIRLKGKGGFTLLDILREFYVGGDK